MEHGVVARFERKVLFRITRWLALGLSLLLFLALIVMGIGITFFSTHRSVTKYLKMKLDDLY